MNMRVKNLEQTSCCSPTQWEGETVKGQFVYIRCDDYDLTVEVSKSEEQWMKGKSATVFYCEDGSYCGVMGTDEMLDITGIILV